MHNLFRDVIKSPLTLFILVGMIFILIACSEVHEFKSIVTVEHMNTSNWVLLAVGSVFILISSILLILKQIKLNHSNYEFKEISLNTKYTIFLSHNKTPTINIIYGNMTDVGSYGKGTLFILPANDKFDDSCIDDKETVMGSFVNKLYPQDNNSIKQKIQKEFTDKYSQKPNIGNWILIPSDIKEGKTINMGIVAVTHLTDDGRIIARPENVILAFNSIYEIISKNRAATFFIPLIGSGNGGLAPELSLLCLIVSIIECTKKEGGHNIKEANIVIYRKSDGSDDLSVEKMKTIVKFVLCLYKK